MFGGGQSLTWQPHWCFALMRLFGSRGACCRHRSCTLGVSKRFGAVSGHLPVVTIQVLRRLRHHCPFFCLLRGWGWSVLFLAASLVFSGCLGHAAPVVVIVAAFWGLARGLGQ